MNRMTVCCWRWLATAMLLCPVWAHAQLLGVGYDRSARALQVIEIDPASGTEVVRGSLAEARVLAPAGTAYDPFSQQVFFLSKDPVDAEWHLLSAQVATGNATDRGSTGLTGQVVALAFDRDTSRLLTLVREAGVLQVLALDAFTAASTVVHHGASDCCVMDGNVSALSAQGFLIAGRRLSDAEGTHRLIRFAVDGSDDFSASAPMSGTLEVLVSDPGSGHMFGLSHVDLPSPDRARAQLVDVAADGSFLSIGSGELNCCVVDVDIATIESGQLRLVARALDLTPPIEPVPARLVSIDLATGVFSSSAAPLSSGRTLNGLFDSIKGVVPSTTTITDITPASPSEGQPYQVTAIVEAGALPLSGNVLVTDSTGAQCNFALPQDHCSLTPLAGGPQTVTASFIGGAGVGGSSDVEAITVRALSTTSIVSVVPSPVDLGTAYQVEVSVSGFGTPTGVVSVSDGVGANCDVVLPATTCSLTSQQAGNLTLTASYSGDLLNGSSLATQSHQVNRVASTTQVLSVLPSPVAAGQPYTVTAQATGLVTASGSITVDDGDGVDCVITLPATSCVLTSVTAGAKTVTANYSGDANLLPSATTAAQTVTQAVTSLQIDATPDPAVVAQSTQLQASVLGGVSNPAGTVQFLADATPIIGCEAVSVSAAQATCTTTFSTPGDVLIQANYSGDANNLSATQSRTLTVGLAATTTSLSLSQTSIPAGVLVIARAEVSGGIAPNDGSVSFTLDGAPISACQAMPLIAGITECPIQTALQGTRVVMAAYSGDSDEAPSSDTASLQVLDALTIPTDNGGALWLLALSVLGLGWRRIQRY
ncbi:MAG: Ig-like domain-containing protein [Lysobacteraceae bacterium]